MIAVLSPPPPTTTKPEMHNKTHLSLHKILFQFTALLWASIVLLFPPPTCRGYSIAILLHDHCGIYAPPTDPAFYGIDRTMNTVTIRFFTLPLKIFLDSGFSAAFSLRQIIFINQKISLERLREFDRFMQPKDKNAGYCRRLAIRESFSTTL